MGLSSQFQSCLFFFNEKISRAQKHVTSKNQITKQKQANTKQQRQQFSRAHKLLGVTCFCAREIFS